MAATSSTSRRIAWPSVITIISATILIGAEVFGAAFAAAWALSTLIGLEGMFALILRIVLFALGAVVMWVFIRGAQRVEPFTESS
ncbi:MAG: hypothetical protein FWD68_09990 [Alphaproteobacteria bacterium]|nr:hypothetical protein [Alphaproteobacteria bacterium]